MLTLNHQPHINNKPEQGNNHEPNAMDEFNELVKLWLDGKISYTRLVENRPVHDESLTYRILKSLADAVR